MRHFLQKWWFGFTHHRWFGFWLAAGLIFFESAITGILIMGTPQGSRWLGATIFNTGDLPVYLGYLAQAKNSFLLSNLYNNLPQIPRFDLFWSLGGLLVRLGLTPLWAHEILRWICTLILALAIYATAHSLASTEKQTRLASLFMIGGLSTGWLYDLGMGLAHQWTPGSLATADLASEFAIAPTLLGGAHMILSLALQLLTIRWIWEAIRQKRGSKLLPAGLCLLALSAFHPYFIPLFGLISVIALLPHLKTVHWQKPLLSFLGINAAMLPWTVYYVWLIFKDPSFRVHHLQTNYLPLDPWYFWVIMLLPFVPAVYWMMKNKIPQNYNWREPPHWVWAWIISAVICMLLPLSWTRKYTQGLLPALVILTLPFWLMLADKLWTKKIIWPLKICRLVLIAFPFIHLLQTQIFMVTDPEWSKNFYRPITLFQAWDYLKQTSPQDSLLITTDLWSNHWTPTYTLRQVWIGHKHETPNFTQRVTPYLDWIKTPNRQKFQAYLDRIPVTYVVATKSEDVERLAAFMDRQKWTLEFTDVTSSVWQKK